MTYNIYESKIRGKLATTDDITGAVGDEIKKIGKVDLHGKKDQWYKIAGRDKEYPDYKVALAVYAGQIKLSDITIV